MKDLIIAISTLLLSLFIYLSSAGFHDESGGIIGDPAFYPRLLAMALGLMSIVLLINTLRKKVKLHYVLNKELIMSVTKLFGLVVAYMVCLNLFGFIPATIVFTMLSILLFGGTLKTALINFLPITLVIYFVFSQLLSMRLPVGRLFIR